jgi:hypothetical protein
MNKIACRWPVSALGSLVSIQSGGTPDRGNPKYWLGGTIPWVTTAEVNYSEIKHTNERITPEGLANSSAKIFPKGTILMALYGQGKTRGQVGFLGIDAATNQACAAIIPKEKLHVDFLFQFLKGSYSSIRALSNSGGQQNLSSQLLAEIRIVVPPMSEQRKIAAILRTWDEAIENLLRLSELRQKQYRGLRDYLIDWSKNQRAVKEFLRPVSRPVPKPTSGYRALSIRSHGKGTFDRFVENPESVEMDTLFIAKAGDIIVNITFAWEGAWRWCLAATMDAWSLIGSRHLSRSRRKWMRATYGTPCVWLVSLTFSAWFLRVAQAGIAFLASPTFWI